MFAGVPIGTRNFFLYVGYFLYGFWQILHESYFDLIFEFWLEQY